MFVFSLSWCLYALAWAHSENAFDELLVSSQALMDVCQNDNTHFSTVKALLQAAPQPGLGQECVHMVGV